MLPYRTTALLLIVALLPLAGCMGRDGRQGVTGTVTVDGQPLESGLINFRPTAGMQANSSGGAIHDGVFKLPADNGLKPGKYIVTIQAFRETGEMIDDPQLGRIARQAPVRFKESDTLEATVTVGQKNRFDFELTSTP